MNILSRLKKLETLVTPAAGNSTVCACFPQRNVEFYDADLSENSESGEPVLTGESIADICPKCGKTIKKQQIIIQFCDRTTRDRFPEEWNARER
jgi:ABC-type uncharacterized transport system auxiliary subunit